MNSILLSHPQCLFRSQTFSGIIAIQFQTLHSVVAHTEQWQRGRWKFTSKSQQQIERLIMGNQNQPVGLCKYLKVGRLTTGNSDLPCLLPTNR